MWLGPFFGLNAAFFMGFIFFIAGYFSPGSFERKGASKFVGSRSLPAC
jgi:glucans biosynthesis protein C